jgi:hypothetical protein
LTAPAADDYGENVGVSRAHLTLFTLAVIGAVLGAHAPAQSGERPTLARSSMLPSETAPQGARPAPRLPGGEATESARAADPMACGLLAPGSDAAASRDCLVCHGSVAHGGHPYDIDLGRWTPTRRGSALRLVSEVLRRGVWLPDGQVRCVTCHDALSPWKFHIRLPPGSRPTPAVDLTRRVTYENPASLPAPRPGDDVGRKALCLGCHALD